MNFLAPLFLLGALAIGLPVLFHLIRRSPRDRTLFSSLMFLAPSPPRLTRRSRLEHLLLLALRCAVVCLLAFGFARPFFTKAIVEDLAVAPRRVLVLVDTSASMRRADLWTEAKKRVEAVLRRASPLDAVAVFTFDRQVNPVLTFEQWNAAPLGERAALATQRLAAAGPGWSSTRLDSALLEGAELLADTGTNSLPARAELVVITDLQEGAQLSSLQGHEWPKGVTVTVEPLHSVQAGNAGLQALPNLDSSPRNTKEVRVRVVNTADAKAERFQVGWAEAAGGAFAAAPVEVYLPTGQSRVLALPLPPRPTVAERVLLKGDGQEFDNTVYLVPPGQSDLQILYFGVESETEPKAPLFFLWRAFQPGAEGSVRLVKHPAEEALQAGSAAKANLFIVTELTNRRLARQVHEQIVEGKTAFVTVSRGFPAGLLAELLGVERVNLREATVKNYAMLTDIDFRHPLFTPFADPRFSDFTKIRFWRYRELEASAIPNARVAAKFDNGAPALLDFHIGKGRVFLLTSTWQPDDSQLALSSKFVPLLYAALELGGGESTALTELHVGDPIPITSSTIGATVRTPDGAIVSLKPGEKSFDQTLVPGVYSLTEGEQTKRFAVNLDPAESRTTPLSAEELERLGVPLTRPAQVAANEARQKNRLQNSELEARQKLWRWVIAVAMGALLMEIWLAGRAARRAIPKKAEA